MGMTPTFGHWLRQRRKALGLTQKALAQQAGCAEVTLRKIESGDLQPSAPLVTSLAQALRADDADLPALIAMARGLDDDFTAKARLLRPQRPNNLPAQLTPLIGRAHDITVVRRRLLSDGARLVTLVGPPGVGKTRLSLAVAEDVLDQFDDGVFFVRLAPVSDPDQVAAAIAQALGLQMSGPNPPELQLRAYLEEKHLLLVLDNFEQIVAAAPLVDDLLRRCPWLHVLVTSRQPLRVRGERQVTVQPLALPASALAGGVATAKDMLRYPAVELFADRAEAVLPDFAVDDGNAAAVAELCRRLDGLPLAIELVAARVKLLPPAALLQRLHGPWLLSTDGLRDVSARQKTLRGAIGWSYDLLSPAQQTLFRYLSVFVGGFTLEAAELLCGDTLSPPLPLTFSSSQVLDGIGSLVDNSLLHRESGLYGGPRYATLETVREYALERLVVKREETALRERHARCFLDIIDRADMTEINPRKPLLNRLIDNEIHNTRKALSWTFEHDTQAALILTTHLVHWYGQRGPFREGARLNDEVLNLARASDQTIARARLLFEAGILMIQNDDVDKAQLFEEQSLELSRAIGYRKGEADALLGLGRVSWIKSAWSTALEHFACSLAIYRALNEPGGAAYALVLMANVKEYSGTDLVQARTLAEESVSIAQQTGFIFPWPKYVLGAMLLNAGDLTTARLMLEQTLAEARIQEGKPLIFGCLMDLGEVATRQKDFTAAKAFLNEALVLKSELGNHEDFSSVFRSLAHLATATGKHHQAVILYKASFVATRGRSMSDYLIGVATFAVALNQCQLAANILGTVDSLAETVRPLDPIEKAGYARNVELIRTHLDDVEFESARTIGRRRTFEETAVEAISILEKALDSEEPAMLAGESMLANPSS